MYREITAAMDVLLAAQAFLNAVAISGLTETFAWV